MINWESILPEKREDEDFEYKWNKAISACIESLESAERIGEICKPLSVEEISEIMHDVIMCRGLNCKYCGVDRIRLSRAAHRIHNSMFGKETT